MNGKKYCIYKHIFPNNKVYIGITCRKPKYRWNNGKECAEYLGCHRSSPNLTCNGVQKTCKGYHLMWLDELNQRNSMIANTLSNFVC